MKSPTVSVVIPTYNRPHLVGRAIESVQTQTFQDFEIIVVDDGQERRADEIVHTYTDLRIRYIANSVQRGCAGAKNVGAQHAEGEYIAFLDDDDVWLPEKLQKQVAALSSAASDVAVCFTACYEFFDDRKYLAQTASGVKNYHELVLRDFSAIHGSMLMYKTDAFHLLGGFNEQYPTHTDVEFLIRFTQKYRGIGINEPLVERKLESAHTQMGSNIENRIKGRRMILEEFKEAFKKHPSFRAKHIERLAKFYRVAGNYQAALKCFIQSFILQPRLARLLHGVSMLGAGIPYRVYRWTKQRI